MQISSVIATREMVLLTAEQSVHCVKLYEDTKYNGSAERFSRKFSKSQFICAQNNFGKM